MAQSESVIGYLVRHGATAADDANQFDGWGNYPVSPRGRREALEAGKKLQKLDVGDLQTSPLVRTQETAEIIGRLLGKRATVNENLRTWNVGDFTGKDRDKWKADLQYYRNNPSKKVPGGEPFDAFYDRLTNFIRSLRQNRGKPPVAITSRSIIRHAGELLGKRISEDDIHGNRIFEVYQDSDGPQLRVLKVQADSALRTDWPRVKGLGNQRMSAEQAGYMELEGAEKTAECEKVAVKGGVSRDLGCCNEYQPVLASKRFMCGMCEYLITPKDGNAS